MNYVHKKLSHFQIVIDVLQNEMILKNRIYLFDDEHRTETV